MNTTTATAPTIQEQYQQALSAYRANQAEMSAAYARGDEAEGDRIQQIGDYLHADAESLLRRLGGYDLD
jgi:hypothetical protein